MSKEIEIILEPLSTKFNSSDARWLSEINELIVDCQRQVGKVKKVHIPQAGKKSGIETLILALGTSGAITALVTVFKSWLARDKTRNIKIKVDKNGEKEEYEISSNGLNIKTIEETLNKMLQSQEE